MWKIKAVPAIKQPQVTANVLQAATRTLTPTLTLALETAAEAADAADGASTAAAGTEDFAGAEVCWDCVGPEGMDVGEGSGVDVGFCTSASALPLPLPLAVSLALGAAAPAPASPPCSEASSSICIHALVSCGLE